MHMRGVWTVIAAVLLGLVVYTIFFYDAKGGNASDAPREVTWLLSHQPTDVFARAVGVFAQTLENESGGSLSLRVIYPKDVGVEKGDVPHATVLQLLDAGSVDVASVYTIPLGNTFEDFRILNLPFLFDSYERTNAVLDDTALPILDQLDGAIRGLAFTMSGGFRIIASKDLSIEDIQDFKGKRIVTSGGPVAEATLRALGATPVSQELESGSARDFSSIDGVETTYARLSAVLGSDTAFTAHINETNHSMFLTAVVAGGSFFDSLTPLEQRALISAARAAAKVEREDSMALNESVKEILRQGGSTIHELSTTSREAFVAATKSVYQEYSSRFSPDIYEAVVRAR